MGDKLVSYKITDKWGGVSQERLLGGGDANAHLVPKETMLVNCAGELRGGTSKSSGIEMERSGVVPRGNW